MTRLFNAYRILAIAVGIFLLGASIDFVLHKLNDGIPDLWWLWMLHGYVYMAYLIVAIPFVRRARWPLRDVALIIAAGLIPVLMFFVEHYVSKRYRSEHPEVFATA